MDSIRMKVAQFRAAVKDTMPYFLNYVYGMAAVEKRGIGTMAVDEHGRLYYDPSLVEKVDVKAGRFVVTHESLHVSLGHAPLARKVLGDRPTRDMLRRWNWAADCVVNGILQPWWHEAPSEEVLGGQMVTHVTLGLPPGLTVVQYYNLIADQEEQAKQEQSLRHAGGDDSDDDDPSQGGEGETDEDMEGDDDGDDEEDSAADRDDGVSEPAAEGDRGDRDSEDGGDGAEGDEEGGESPDEGGDSGSEGGDPDDGDDSGCGDADSKGDDDSDRDGEEGDGDSGSGDGSEGGSPADDADGEADGSWPRGGGSGADGFPRGYEDEVEAGWKDREHSLTDMLEQRITEAETAAPGSVPGCLKAAVNLRLRPQADPFDVLRATVARAIASPVGAPDYTLRKFSRRQQADGPRLRGIKTETPNCVVILDTSGSMLGGDRVTRAMDVIAKAVRRLRSVKVVCFDARLHDRKMVTSMGQFKWEGGGGTDMGRAIEEVDKADRPDAIVLVTDLETDWPQRQPRARVVVAAVDAKEYWLERVPGWVKLCDVSKGGA
jgi:predicted metal-dependent peptidase